MLLAHTFMEDDTVYPAEVLALVERAQRRKLHVPSRRRTGAYNVAIRLPARSRGELCRGQRHGYSAASPGQRSFKSMVRFILPFLSHHSC